MICLRAELKIHILRNFGVTKCSNLPQNLKFQEV
jgi:hypothetical protein